MEKFVFRSALTKSDFVFAQPRPQADIKTGPLYFFPSARFQHPRLP